MLGQQERDGTVNSLLLAPKSWEREGRIGFVDWSNTSWLINQDKTNIGLDYEFDVMHTAHCR